MATGGVGVGDELFLEQDISAPKDLEPLQKLLLKAENLLDHSTLVLTHDGIVNCLHRMEPGQRTRPKSGFMPYHTLRAILGFESHKLKNVVPPGVPLNPPIGRVIDEPIDGQNRAHDTERQVQGTKHLKPATDPVAATRISSAGVSPLKCSSC